MITDNPTELRALHATLVERAKHREAEQVSLPEGPDRDHARRKFEEATRHAGYIERRLDQLNTEEPKAGSAPLVPDLVEARQPVDHRLP